MFILLMVAAIISFANDNSQEINKDSLKKYFKGEFTYKVLTGPLFVEKIPKLAELEESDHEDFEILLKNFEYCFTLQHEKDRIEREQNQNAITIQSNQLYKEFRRDLALKLFSCPKCSKQEILNGVLNTFCVDMQSFIEALYTLKNDTNQQGNFLHHFSNGLLKYQVFKRTKLDRSLEIALNTLMLIRSNGRKNYTLGSVVESIRSYGECRLDLFEELLRLSIKNGWNRFYSYPINFFLSDQILCLLHGTNVRFLKDSEDIDLKKFEENSVLLIKCAKLYKKLHRFAFRVNALHLNNFESTIYSSSVLNTPALYMNYIKSQRNNHWLNKYVRTLFSERAGYINQDDIEEEARIEEILSEIVYRVFDEYGLVDALPHSEYLFES